MNARWRGALLVLIAVFITAAPAVGQSSNNRPTSSGPAHGNYRVGPEDVLDIVVWNNAEMSRTVPVRPDGMISLPLLNDVRAAGLTAMQIRDVLAARLTEYMPMPEVSVIVKEVRSAKVTVIGQVRTPGRYDLKNHTTVMDVLAQAGPFTDFAALSRIFVLRQNGSTATHLSFDYSKAVRRGQQENFVLEPGDIVVVP